MGSGQVVQPELNHPHIQPGEGTFAAPFDKVRRLACLRGKARRELALPLPRLHLAAPQVLLLCLCHLCSHQQRLSCYPQLATPHRVHGRGHKAACCGQGRDLGESGRGHAGSESRVWWPHLCPCPTGTSSLCQLTQSPKTAITALSLDWACHSRLALVAPPSGSDRETYKKREVTSPILWMRKLRPQRGWVPHPGRYSSWGTKLGF